MHAKFRCTKKEEMLYDTFPLISSYSYFIHACKDGFFRHNDAEGIHSLCRRDISLLSDGDAVFVVTEELGSFWSQFVKIQKPLKIILGRSDETIDDRFLPLVEHPNTLHLFAQNCTILHPKVTGIPLGIENVGWQSNDNPTNRLDLLRKAMKSNLELRGARSQILTSFNVDSSPVKRLPAMSQLMKMPFEMRELYKFPSQHTPSTQYQFYEAIARHKFTACPHGNGIDTHRFWQAIYLGSVPITTCSIAYDSSLDCGVLMLDDWIELLDLDLNKIYNEKIGTRNLKKALLPYWIEKIKTK